MFDLTGRTALITGAGQGMGLGVAKAFAAAGAKVIINDLYADRANLAAESIGENAIGFAGDITKKSIQESAATDFGTIDILVNNAGVPEGMATTMRQADQLSEKDYQRQMDLNHHAIRGLCRSLLPAMKAQGHGRILVITSEAHRLGIPIGLSHYASAKAATIGYMKHLAAELGKTGVTVNALSLGTMNNFEGHERAAATTLIGRAGTPEDVGAAALYLCSDEASWMTGQTIALNGGACTA